MWPNKERILKELNEELASISSLQDLDKLKAKYLGKNGLVRNLTMQIKDIPPDERKEYGVVVNEIKYAIEEIFSQKISYFQ